MTGRSMRSHSIPAGPSCHVVITDDGTSSTSGEPPFLKSADADTGHERLLRHTATGTANAIQHCRPSRPPHDLILAILVTILINPAFGSVAVLCSLWSRQCHKHNAINDAKRWGNISKWMSIVGSAISLVVAAFLVVYYVYIDKNIVDTQEELQNN